MTAVLLQLWDALAGLPHLRGWLTAGWLVYLLWLGGWILLQKREPAATLSWLVSLAALPVLGFLIYYIFGPQRLHRQRRRRHRRHAGLPRDAAAPVGSAQELRTLAEATTGLAPTTAQSVQLLVDGDCKFPALLAAIDAAQQHIHLSYYIFEPDQTGQALRDHLIARARAGVAVRLLIDAVGSKRAGRRFFAPLLEAGGEVVRFHPTQAWWPWRRPWLNLRTHRKLAIIDGRVGFIGGINITDEEDPRLRADAYRDLHLRLEGDAVRSLQEVFVEDWAYASGQRSFIAAVERSMPARAPGPLRVQLISSGPDSRWEAIHRLHVGAIHAADRRVWLSTPYFVPGEAALMALTSAALGGLDVRLLVPRMSDSRLVTYCVRSWYDELLEAGVRVYEYGPRMLHTKALLVDDRFAILGSANFDHRSFRLNFEASLSLDDAGFAATLEAHLQQELDAACEVRRDRPRPLLRARLPEAAARLLAPLL